MRFPLLLLVLLALLATISPVQAVDWEAAIKKVEKSQEEYVEFVRDRTGSAWVGSMYAGYEFDRHQCAIIGRMLGLQDVIVDLETMPYPPMTDSSDMQDLLVFAASLESWTIAARRAVDMDEAGRRNVWNLDCIGHLGISTQHYVGNDRPEAQFVVDGTMMRVYGDIDEGFYERLKSALDANAGVDTIALGSGGGSVRDALLSGYEIRARGIGTTIYGNCYSACPLVFMGGKDRNLWASTNRLGFHQISRAGQAVPMDDEIYVLTATYLIYMNVDPETVLRWMASAAPDDMFEPDVRELCTAGVATWVQRICPF